MSVPCTQSLSVTSQRTERLVEKRGKSSGMGEKHAKKTKKKKKGRYRASLPARIRGGQAAHEGKRRTDREKTFRSIE